MTGPPVLCQIFTIWQGGSRTEMNIGDLQGHGHFGQVNAAQLIDLVGKLFVTVQGSYGTVDDEIGSVPFKILLDIFWFTETEFFAVGG